MTTTFAGRTEGNPWLDRLPPDKARDFWRWALTPPRSPKALQLWMHRVLGLWVSDVRCKCHGSSPLDALWAAYSAEATRVVWKGSRGLSGKTVLLAGLALCENITLGAGVSLLGGSGEQSRRVHEYMSGSEMPRSFWNSPFAPRHLLTTDPSQQKSKLKNGGWMKALMASSASVRGPHPERLRGDEIDEMDAWIWDSASGQPMSRRTQAGHYVRRQIVGSSTHHYATGTMTRELKMAAEKGWPVFEWCYRANLWHPTLNPYGWLTEQMVEETRSSVTTLVWQTEYELQEPSVEGRAIDTPSIDKMFKAKLGEYAAPIGTRLTFEEPVEDATYAAGADWGKNRDKSIFWIWRTDVIPMRCVVFFHLGRMSYKRMIPLFDGLLEKYRAPAAHDATGLGTVVEDFVESGTATPVKLVGALRAKIFRDYIVAIERGEVEAPMIDYAYQEHKFVTEDDLTKSGQEYHPPDTFVAGALAYYAATNLFGDLVY